MAVHIRKEPVQPIAVTVPGKLVLAGEYAVLAPGEPGLVAAVSPGLTARWEPGEALIVSAPALGVGPVSLDEAQTALPFVARVASVIREATGQPVPSGALTLSGSPQLDGQKVGLGSSAGACVAAVRAWLQAMKQPVTAETVFRLAGVAHARQQRNGSAIDIAAISYGGIGLYRSLGTEFLGQLSGTAILKTPFASPVWQSCSLPAGAVLRAGFTGQSAATGPAVAQVLTWAEANPERWIEFAGASRQAVTICSRGLESGQLPTFHRGIREARRVLRGLGEAIGLTIETPMLAALADSAEALGASGKSSGAGGGDCGIAVVAAGDQERRLMARWHQLGIRDVPIALADA